MSISNYFRFAIEVLTMTLYLIWICILKLFGICFRPRPKSLKGEIILITGGSSGIGLEICHELARREKDLTIIVWNTNKQKNSAVITELQQLGVKNAHGFIVDVSNREQVKTAAKEIRQQIGDVTMLFNNAGITGDLGPTWNLRPENIEKVLNVNMTSYYWTVSEFLPAMLREGKGHIVATASILSFMHGEMGSPYIVSKHGIDAFMECLKEDVRKLAKKAKIHFTTAYPQATDTAMMDNTKLKSGRYPFLLPYHTATYVAKRIVTGVLVNQEHIYFPPLRKFGRVVFALLPSKVIRKILDMIELQYDSSGKDAPTSIRVDKKETDASDCATPIAIVA